MKQNTSQILVRINGQNNGCPFAWNTPTRKLETNKQKLVGQQNVMMQLSSRQPKICVAQSIFLVQCSNKIVVTYNHKLQLGCPWDNYLIFLNFLYTKDLIFKVLRISFKEESRPTMVVQFQKFDFHCFVK